MRNLIKLPSPPLAEYIERFWYSSGAPAHRKLRVLPSGTFELVFNLEEDDLGFFDNDQDRDSRRFSGGVFSGAYAGPLFVETRGHVMGVHFRPGGAFRFLGIPATEVANTHVDVALLWRGFMRGVREQLCTTIGPAKRLLILENALLSRLKHHSGEHRAVRAAVEILQGGAGDARTRELASHLGLSERHFIKVFSTQVGLTPKTFARVQRFQRALALTQQSASPDWADIAVACGYFDQSHLIHEFQTFSGFNPTAFHRERKRVFMNHVRPPE